MFEQEMKLNAAMLGLVSRFLDDIDEEQLAIPAVPGWNPPAWILGHLAVTNDYALRTLGEARVAPSEWHKRFHPGAKPEDDKSPLPTKEELLSTLKTGRERLLGAIGKADPEKLKQPHGAELLKGTPIETLGDVVAHLMTTHYAFHIGQLSAWRRGLGKPALI